jgi:hypothetical protein
MNLHAKVIGGKNEIHYFTRPRGLLSVGSVLVDLVKADEARRSANDVMRSFDDPTLKLFGHPLPPGLTMISALAQYGKTKLAKAITNIKGEDESSSAVLFSVGEPESAFLGSDWQINVAILTGVAAGATVIGIDSITTLLNSGSGALRKGGVSREIDMTMRSLTIIAASANVSIIATLNPGDFEALDLIHEAAVGSAAFAVKITDIRQHSDSSISLTVDSHYRPTRQTRRGHTVTLSEINMPDDYASNYIADALFKSLDASNL